MAKDQGKNDLWAEMTIFKNFQVELHRVIAVHDPASEAILELAAAGGTKEKAKKPTRQLNRHEDEQQQLSENDDEQKLHDNNDNEVNNESE